MREAAAPGRSRKVFGLQGGSPAPDPPDGRGRGPSPGRQPGFLASAAVRRAERPYTALFRAAASRRSSFTTWASASGFTPFSRRPIRIAKVSLSSPVSSILEISCATVPAPAPAPPSPPRQSPEEPLLLQGNTGRPERTLLRGARGTRWRRGEGGREGGSEEKEHLCMLLRLVKVEDWGFELQRERRP